MIWEGRTLHGKRYVRWESAWYDVGGAWGIWEPAGYEYVSLEGITCFAAWVRS